MVRFLFVLFCALSLTAQEARIQVLATAGMQGRVLPKDPFTLQPANMGWAAVASVLRGLKAGHPDTLLLDCGNLLSGDPVNYVRNRLKPALPEPSIAIMNALGYHAFSVGGREYDFGFSVLRTVEEMAQFPFLSANTVFASTGKGAFTPYVKVAVGGLQVAILGLTAVSVPRADATSLLDLTFTDPVETAKNLVPKLRDKEKADLVIVALHGNLSPSVCVSSGPDPARCLAEKVPGIDLIIAGGSAAPQGTQVGAVPVLQTHPRGGSVGVADLRLRKDRGHWRVERAELRHEPVRLDGPLDPQVLDLTATLRTETELYLNTYATNLTTDLDGRWSRMEDSVIVQLLHGVMRRATGAQLTAVASPGSKIYIPKGPTSVRQFYALAPGEERVARIRISGAQLRKYLEHAARFYNFSYQPDLYNRTVDPADFDMIYGVDYALDLSKPVGQRVAKLAYRNEPVTDGQMFTLGISTYRLAGGGGYMEAIGFKGAPEVISTTTLRNLLLEQVLSKPTLTIPLANNWRTIPHLDRERVLFQQP